jgi:hypothetical protein
MKNRQVLLARRPRGEFREEDFRIVDAPIPAPDDGEALVRNRFLSLDPYMRMSDLPSYAPRVELGEIMVGARWAKSLNPVRRSRHLAIW